MSQFCKTRIEAKFLTKLRPRWSHHGRSWGQVVSKMVQVRAKLAPRWANFAPKWPTWCPFGGYLAQDRLQTRIEAKFLAKLRPRWAHHGRSWGQLCPRRSKLEPSWRQDGPILSLNGRIETILGGILVIFLDSGQDLCRNRRSVKTTNPPSLLVFF